MHNWKLPLVVLPAVLVISLRAVVVNADIYNRNGTLVPDGAGVDVSASADLSHLNLQGANLPNVQADGANFKYSNLNGAVFSGANLSGATFQNSNANADFRDANLADANLSNASFGADVRGANLTNANLSKARLHGAKLAGANLTDATIKDASFTHSTGLTAAQLYSTASYKAYDLGAISLAKPEYYNSDFDLSGWDFSDQKLNGADFTGAKLTGAIFTNAEISGVNFRSASGLSFAQIQSTKSYQDRNLAGINLTYKNFSGADFSQQNLSNSVLSVTLRNANLSNANLTGASLSRSDLAGADLTDANITRADFSEVTTWGAFTATQLYSTANYKQRNLAGLNLSENILDGWNFSGQNLANTNFTTSALTGADFTNANIKEANFSVWEGFLGGTGISPEQLYVTASYQARDLSNTIFIRNDFSGVNLSAQNLSDTSLSWATLTAANLTDANLQGADFYNADLTNADLRRANLVDAFVAGADLRGANLSNANLQNANFRSTNLTGTNLTGADIRGAALDNVHGRFSLAQLMTTASYQAKDLSGVTLIDVDLRGADFANFNLSDVNFEYPNLAGANLSGARINGTTLRFGGYTVWLGSTQWSVQYLTAEQLYSTASYQARDLSRTIFSGGSSNIWNFADQNLQNASFVDFGLYRADLSGADIRGANFSASSGIRRDMTSSLFYSTASYQLHDLTGINLSRNDLTSFDLSDQNLSKAQFSGAVLAGANFAGAQIGGANFANTTTGGFSAQQLYSTASYQAGDLAGVRFGGNNMSGWNFAGKNLAGVSFIEAAAQTELANANFTDATLTGASMGRKLAAANFTRADLRDAIMYNYNINLSGSIAGTDFTAADTRGLRSDTFERMTDFFGAITTNMIRPDGRIHGLNLNSGAILIVRNYKGTPSYTNPNAVVLPVPIVVHREFTIDSTSSLKIVFDSETWGSTISFSPDIPVSLGGTLNLSFAANVNLLSQIGRTFDVFDWTGVNPSGTFNVSSPYVWDLSNLYTTGDVTLLALTGIPGDFNSDGFMDSADYVAWRKGLGITFGHSANHVWRAHFGQTAGIDAGSSAYATLPEPPTLVVLMCAAVSWCRKRRRAAQTGSINSLTCNTDQ